MKGIYIVGGYPDRKTFQETFRITAESGIDFIEVGIPFSEPVADGPVIAKAINAALKNGITAKELLEDLKSFKNSPIKKYVMTYSNIIYGYGIKEFSKDFGPLLSGIIIADLPNRLHEFFYEKGFEIPIIPFVSPESRKEDLELIKKLKGDFIYFIGIRGITGGSVDLSSKEIKERIAMLRELKTHKIVMGFGIKSRAEADKALEIADGYVIGTAAVEKQDNPKEYKKFIESLQ